MRNMSRSNRHYSFLFVLALLVPALLALAACGDDQSDGDDSSDTGDTPTEQTDEPEPTATEPTSEPDPTEPPTEDEATPTPTPASDSEATATPEEDETADDEEDTGERQVLIYLVRNEQVATASRTIAGTPEVAAGAMNELLTGITPYEEDLGFGTEVPFETEILGINLQDDGTVIIDLSSQFESGGGSFSMQMRVAQVVYTLTQFDTIDQVQFLIEGQEVEAIGGEGVMVDEPLDRSDFEDLTPAILVESPTPGEEVRSPMLLTGTANTFEATFQVEVVDNSGTVIYDDFATATSGTGDRGTFELEIPFDVTQEGNGTVTVYEESARDGSPMNIVEIPVDLRQ